MAITDTYKLLSDEELVAKYHSGDEKAADYLIEKYKNLVRKMCVHIILQVPIMKICFRRACLAFLRQ